MFIDVSEFVDRYSAFDSAGLRTIRRRAMRADRKCDGATARQTRGRPQDIADPILFTMKNGFPTGITLTIDGGRLLT